MYNKINKPKRQVKTIDASEKIIFFYIDIVLYIYAD